MKFELPTEKKMTVVCRVEGGCLGPTGADHIDGFCDFAKNEFSSWEADVICWEIVPRLDKSLPELQYKIAGRNLSRDQAKKYLKLFDKDINVLEAEIDETLLVLIEEYMTKQ